MSRPPPPPLPKKTPTGAFPPEEPKTPVYEVCPRCEGEGVVALNVWESDNTSRVSSETCPLCDGEKRVTKEKLVAALKPPRPPSGFP